MRPLQEDTCKMFWSIDNNRSGRKKCRELVVQCGACVAASVTHKKDVADMKAALLRGARSEAATEQGSVTAMQSPTVTTQLTDEIKQAEGELEELGGEMSLEAWAKEEEMREAVSLLKEQLRTQWQKKTRLADLRQSAKKTCLDLADLVKRERELTTQLKVARKANDSAQMDRVRAEAKPLLQQKQVLERQQQSFAEQIKMAEATAGLGKR